jgi:ABC-type antimicrobial peptide transport system permease subunit
MSSTAEPQESLKRIGFAPAAASVLLSVAIGLLAGLWPAIQAARRPPVDALREPTS